MTTRGGLHTSAHVDPPVNVAWQEVLLSLRRKSHQAMHEKLHLSGVKGTSACRPAVVVSYAISAVMAFLSAVTFTALWLSASLNYFQTLAHCTVSR